ncbi:hypothetical protein B0H67DRAFT_338130 [Lasiosphaeris hirsuta]|uniref:Uncharacterized protein n=1 Tax=Lasiosphaeris hirsuta TaxID=260670 RepID=A0AA40A372_9PEZI|nr:hypothetical protein B0H67DRAFT_338130 [Lasiosphaeris hirsuta]
MTPTAMVTDGGMSPRQDEGGGTGKKKRKRRGSVTGSPARKKIRKGQGRTGRPKNKPAPEPPPTPIPIAPRLGPSAGLAPSHPEGNLGPDEPPNQDPDVGHPDRGVPAHQVESTEQTTSDSGPPSQTTSSGPMVNVAQPQSRLFTGRGMLPMSENPLRADESKTMISFMDVHGREIELETAIISPNYPTFIPIQVVGILGLTSDMRDLERRRSYFTPRGTMEFRRCVGVQIRLGDPVFLDFQPVLFNVLEREDQDPGIPAVIGREFLAHCRSVLWPTWPLRNYSLEESYVSNLTPTGTYVDSSNPIETINNVPLDMEFMSEYY